VLPTTTTTTTTIDGAHNEHEAHGDVNTSHSEAVSHDVAKEAAEHEEHLTHVLHQLQNKPWRFMLLVCFSYFQWGFGFLCYSTGTSGWSPVLFRVMQGITVFLPHPLYLLYFNFCGLHFNHLFIWLDPEVAHDALIATKVGYLNFPFC
jgi:cystathionine beta-lyase/cystathionine gamma-synthase